MVAIHRKQRYAEGVISINGKKVVSREYIPTFCWTVLTLEDGNEKIITDEYDFYMTNLFNDLLEGIDE